MDAFGGIRDLKQGIIRCVGDPYERFTEDALRILRAVRFAAQLGFSIEERTKKAAQELAPTLAKISVERIATELTKLLVSKNPHLLKTAWEAGITKVVLPEFDAMMETPQNTPHHCLSVGEHTLKSLEYVDADKILRFTMLLHDTGKPASRTTDDNGRDHFKGHSTGSEKTARNVLRRLKLDNDTIQKVTKLVYWHDYRPEPNAKAVRRALNKVGEDLFPLLLKVQYADTMAQSEYRREEKLERIRKVEEIYRGVLERKECVSVKTLAVNGRDLIEAGMKPGPEIGGMLNRLLEEVLEEPEINEKGRLMGIVERELGRG